MNSAPRLIFFGVDGASWHVIDKLLEKDELPTINKLLKKSARGVLKSFEPMVSPVIWTTIGTGMLPEKHGVKDFVASSKHVRSKRIWEILDAEGLKIGVCGCHVTWPPKRVNGFIIPDSFAQGPETFPEELSFIREMDIGEKEGSKKGLYGYFCFGIKALRYGVSIKNLLDALLLVIKIKLSLVSYNENFFQKRKLALRIYTDVFFHRCKKEKVDACFFVSTLVDSTSHNFWKYFEPEKFEDHLTAAETKKHKDKVVEAYKEVDKSLAKMIKLGNNQTTVVIVSDHGFQSAMADLKSGDRLININSSKIAETLNLPDSVRTFNIRGRGYFRERNDKQDVIDSLNDQIRLIRIDGTTTQFFKTNKTDFYLEVSLDDSVASPEGVELRLPDGRTINSKELVSGTSEAVSGIHHLDGIYAFSGANIKTGRVGDVEAADITPTLLYLLDFPVDREMDGRVVTELVKEEFLGSRKIRFIDILEEGAVDSEDYGVATEELKNRLRELGYL